MKKILHFIILTSIFAVSCNTAKFSLNEKNIIKQNYQEDIMPLMLVSNKTDSIILYTKSIFFKVDFKNNKLKKLVRLLYNTCNDSVNPGVGIAAPQVGINKRIIWVQRFDKEKEPFEVYFNAEIINFSSSKTEGFEGCLSVPGFRGFVKRSDTIILKYDTYEKENCIDTVTGFTAVIFQHEIDHLEGTLYTDRIWDKSNLYTEEEFLRYKKLLNKNSSD